VARQATLGGVDIMKAKHAIEALKRLDKEEEIVIAFWTQDWFTDVLGREITEDQWLDIIGACDDVIDNMPIGDYMENAAAQVLDGEE
jgi:putative AlgH/UPF0301 family transcriptional regulator